MKLGVFDSGIGGEAVAASLRLAFPAAQIKTANDSKNVPYGSKTTKQVIALTDLAIQPLLLADCDVIVLACNTASAAAIETLRQRYPNQAFIGLEPMVKPAALLTKTGVIAVCATPSTLASKRYAWLVDTYASNTTILQPDCSRWANMIENNQINQSEIKQVITACHGQGADVIVLGCTHYHWIKDLISEIAGDDVTVLEPSNAIANRIRHILTKTELPTGATIARPLPAS